jgi:hypothetical protein
MLSHLPHLQQLTLLDLACSVAVFQDSNLPAAAFSALTASSKLQHLNVNYCRLPRGAWQHMFPAGRQLPHLQSLAIAGVTEAEGGESAAAPEGTRLVSCCPGLRSLNMQYLRCSTELLSPLQRLSWLHVLQLGSYMAGWEGMEAVSQLTGLQKLTLRASGAAEGLLLKLTELKHVTLLDFYAGVSDSMKFMAQVGFAVVVVQSLATLSVVRLIADCVLL